MTTLISFMFLVLVFYKPLKYLGFILMAGLGYALVKHQMETEEKAKRCK